jgi:hypothetical protein
MAKRLTQRGVRLVQVYHCGWGRPRQSPGGASNQCKDVDQGSWTVV